MTTPQIDREKQRLVELAEKHGLDLQHPEVQTQSQRVDGLIVVQMKLQLAKRAG